MRTSRELLEGDPELTIDGLGRETVLRDYDTDGSNFNKYFLEYYHDAQPRREGNSRGKAQTSTLISAVEGNSLLYIWNPYDSARRSRWHRQAGLR